MEKKITTVREPARDIPVRASADILIVGGGPAGLMAAQAAAGEGPVSYTHLSDSQ